ncbi:ATP-dependent RecD-like DNA helicase [Priestia endophytica]|uniref:SF1B family DNA helicase RecD2 n=1 Tax=Priestia endophytica TaxID=135735 RepID=UPI00227FE959|nr:ATP-dependent RecD-like DNA helicase [Priestia endophytica]MCY8233597.1 ATP-dependent RecD-like DNA helicase [Priestia endophytica]
MQEELKNVVDKSDDRPFVKGKISATIFHNEDNLYTVAKISVGETNVHISDDNLTVTGYLPPLHEGERYTFYGQLKEHPRFGWQFQADMFQKELPHSREGVISYLSSDLFKGIGKKTAEKIVDTLGDQAILRILQDRENLRGVANLSSEKADALYEALVENRGLEDVMIKLSQYGFGPQLSMKIFQMYKHEALQIINENPYQLVEDIDGIGFKRADELGGKLGIKGAHPDRIRAGLAFVVEKQCVQDGHTYLSQTQLFDWTVELLRSDEEIKIEDLEQGLAALTKEKKLFVKEERIYIPSLYYAEKGIVNVIEDILAQTQYEDQFPESEFLLALGELEERLDIQYAPSQREAIQKALMSPMMVLTGGPGTGKTTVIKGIVELYAELHGCSLDPTSYKKDEPFPVLLVAPTGRAAKRMSEATGLPAVTIHRLLKWNGQEGFDHDEEDPIKGRLLIVDEVSMVDTWLAHQLFRALPEDMQVVLVGDEDQLPSVGPGQVLTDLLTSDIVPVVRLVDIYRQEEGSSIIELAHMIKDGKMPDDIRKPQGDRSFLTCHQGQITEVVKQVCQNAIKKGFTARDIQVLAPMYKGNAGIDHLNVALQELFNPSSHKRREIQYGSVSYRVGDKVLQLVNQPESNVFNGDIGEIVSVFYAKENTEKQDMLVISFDGNEVSYTKADFNQITHAYCCSIHKSQGSEFPIVVLPVVRSYYRMLKRNLIYTAITRSKQFLILCGEEEALKIGISRADDGKRQTTLASFLKADEQEWDENEAPFMKDAMIGMENVTPYDFMEVD